MCGIAGIIDLSGKRRTPPAGAIRAMADAIIHRGPDEDGYLEEPGVALASRRLSIVGLADGRQPTGNEDRHKGDNQKLCNAQQVNFESADRSQ